MVACIGFIDMDRGKIHFDVKYRSFDSSDVKQALDVVRGMFPGEKVAIFWDNCSIHRSKETKAHVAKMKPPLFLCYNLPYRPDLNPIEKYWAQAKLRYRKDVDDKKTQSHPWCNKELVRNLVWSLDNETAKRCANMWKSLKVARPIKKLDWEQNTPIPQLWYQVEEVSEEDDMDMVPLFINQ